MKSENINELASALSKAQGQMAGALKDSDNPFYKSKYADLAAVWDACRKPLADNGLSVAQLVNGNQLDTILMHSSGQWVQSTATLAPVKNDPQGLGSCVSYMRRYCLSAIVGVFQKDDDAESAVGRAPVKNNSRPDNHQDPRVPYTAPIKR